MNVKILIDSVVRQTTVLIAQLATTGGVRAPLAHIANQVFWELSRELESQGLSRKVSADMFGMALRTYLRRIQWLSESCSDRGRTLWEAVLDHLGEGKLVPRQRILQRFVEDDEAVVKGVLHDLVESGLLLCSGSGAQICYRATTRAERVQLSEVADGSGLEELLWAYVYREGPVAPEALQQFVASEPRRVHQALQRLIESKRVELKQSTDGPRYVAANLEVLLGAPVGWEAAVYDHYHAVVRTISQRLLESFGGDGQATRTAAPNRVGGSTFTFDVWPGHPLETEVLQQLQTLREGCVGLFERVESHNAAHGRPSSYDQVTFYGGQCVSPRNDGEPTDEV
jgi:hypothetical protein